MNKKPHSKLRARMIEKGVTTDYIIKNVVPMSRSTFSAKLNGKYDWNLKKEAKPIADLLCTTVDELFFD